MRIDAHQHFWQFYRGDYGWITPEKSSLYRDFTPDDLRPLLEACDIHRTIVVQAAPTVAETDFLLQLADNEAMIAGVVGWLDLSSSTFLAEYTRLRGHPKFVGVRPMLQDLPEDDWILRPEVIANLQRLADDAFPIDLLVLPRHLPYVIRMLEQVPTLRAVVDHLAKPLIKDQLVEPWQSDMARIAAYPQVMCKVSGMVTEASQDWREADFVPYVHAVLNSFGYARLIYGSDWPVCTERASYQEVYALLHDLLQDVLSPDEINCIYGKNATEFYRLGP